LPGSEDELVEDEELDDELDEEEESELDASPAFFFRIIRGKTIESATTTITAAVTPIITPLRGMTIKE
jgi:hypothetical protein